VRGQGLERLKTENARLLHERNDALEQQAATAEILRVISSSPNDIQPVFDAIVSAGLRLFQGAGVTVARAEDGQVRLMAIAERDPERAQRWKERFPFPLSREYMHGAAILECRMVDMPDVDLMDDRFATGKRNFAASGYRAMTVVPMVRDGAAIGAIGVVRDAPGPLERARIDLLKTFADQAVIAIENVRLFNETKEALEQQKASGEILRAISSSIADTAPVFERILDSCQRLFEGHLVGLTLADNDGNVQLAAYEGPNRSEMQKIYPMPLDRSSGTGYAMLERRVIDFPHIDASVPEFVRAGSRTIGFASIVFAPLLADGSGIGALWVGRIAPGAFGAKQTALLQTFASQAVIAIQNARLFHEIDRKSRELEVASRHKSEFLANMSHELRTPLNAIIGFTRIVMDRSQERIEAKQYENLEKILASGHHLLALINSILDLSKIEAGRVEVHAAEIAPAPVLEHCVRTVEPLVRSDVVLEKHYDDGLPRMYIDEEKLRQIVMNLLSNAAKFTKDGAIRLEARAMNDAVRITVTDTGVGIPPDKLDVIFEEFEQVDASSTRVHGGTGLGLAIARRLSRLMGGDVTAESTLGSGSRFILTLPLRYRA
jgi:signal transduction histidine kinase